MTRSPTISTDTPSWLFTRGSIDSGVPSARIVIFVVGTALGRVDPGGTSLPA